MEIVIWVIVGLLAAPLLFYFFPTFLVSAVLYRRTLVRESAESWGRACSEPEDAETMDMFQRGLAWRDAHISFKKDVHIVSEKLNLWGEYFDFGYDKAVIIIPGRMESCFYSLYYAAPYRDAGYNVLTIDSRAHGLSDGKRSGIGLREYRDVIEWGKFLTETHGVKEIVLHGMCIGAATALYALNAADVPENFTAIIADGMYSTFAESYRRHIVERGHSAFPFLWEVMLIERILVGVDAMRNGPMYCIDQLKKPILFLYTKEDKYASPEIAEMLYGKCVAPKRLVWFEKGKHSRIRINAEEAYDDAITAFLAEKAVLQPETAAVNSER